MKEFLVGWVVAEEELADFCRTYSPNTTENVETDEECIERVSELIYPYGDCGSWYYVDSFCGLYLIGWSIEEFYDMHLDNVAEFYADYGLPLHERSYNVIMCESRNGNVRYKDIVETCKFVTLFED